MKRVKSWLRAVAGLVVLALAFSVGGAQAPQVLAATAREQYEALEKELAELDTAIGQLNDKMEATASQRTALAQQVTILKEQITLLGLQIEEQQAAVVAKQQQIDQKRREMISTDELFRQRIRSLYMMRNEGILSAILGASTYAEALTAADTLQRITQSDTALMDLLYSQKTDLESEERELQTLLDAMENDRAVQEAKLAQLAGNLQALDSSLSALEAQAAAAEDEYKRISEEAKAAKAAAEKEFWENQGHMGDYVGGEFTWPIPGCTVISSGYGPRDFDGFHDGIDIIGSTYGQVYGSAIVAANDGYVTVAQYGTTGYGIRVYVDHGGGVITRYGHCSALAVQAGEYVTRGQVIAYAGASGNVTGPHLHFEVRVNGVTVDPMSYFTAA